jgi:hypothetical protein
VLLLGAVVLAVPDNPDAVAKEPQTGFSVGDNDRRVVDTEKEFVGCNVPPQVVDSLREFT